MIGWLAFWTRRSNMPMSCVAPNCTGRYRRGTNVGYFRIPSDFKRKQLWLKALGKDNWEPKSYHRVCGAHFMSGRPSLDPLDVDFIPNVFNLTPLGSDPSSSRNPVREQAPGKIANGTSEQHSFSVFRAGQMPVLPVHVKSEIQYTSLVKPPVVKDIRPKPKAVVHQGKSLPESLSDDKKFSKPRLVSKATQTSTINSLLPNTIRQQPNHVVFMDKTVFTSEDMFVHEIQSLRSKVNILESRLTSIEQQRSKESVVL